MFLPRCRDLRTHSPSRHIHDARCSEPLDCEGVNKNHMPAVASLCKAPTGALSFVMHSIGMMGAVAEHHRLS